MFRVGIVGNVIDSAHSIRWERGADAGWSSSSGMIGAGRSERSPWVTFLRYRGSFPYSTTRGRQGPSRLITHTLPSPRPSRSIPLPPGVFFHRMGFLRPVFLRPVFLRPRRTVSVALVNVRVTRPAPKREGVPEGVRKAWRVRPVAGPPRRGGRWSRFPASSRACSPMPTRLHKAWRWRMDCGGAWPSRPMKTRAGGRRAAPC